MDVFAQEPMHIKHSVTFYIWLRWRTLRQQILKTLRCGLAVKRMNIEPVIEHFYVLDSVGGALCTFGHLILF